MAIKKTLVTFFFFVILTVLMSNNNSLASGAKINKDKYTCGKTLCTDNYTLYMCMTDCAEDGYAMGYCLSPSPNAPKTCCCTSYK
ncbi:unnamed protein product [Thlaspi arvense]|uniref:Defensin-like domain-containing protein n=1 Tax=Thlaspi arvense TaxID=13288 RepID=A0AAU9RHE9_THLAR|nr:unnamed protein product [Thlaspi arvense]